MLTRSSHVERKFENMNVYGWRRPTRASGILWCLRWRRGIYYWWSCCGDCHDDGDSSARNWSRSPVTSANRKTCTWTALEL